MTSDHVLSARVDNALLGRVDRIAEAMSKRSAGVNIKRGSVLRAIIERGAAELEAELGIAKRKR